MTKRVHKQQLNKHMERNTVFFPEGAQFLAAGNQYNELMVWALVDPALPVKPYTLITLLTGGFNDAPDDLGRYINTVLFEDGGYVVHVFEVKQ